MTLSTKEAVLQALLKSKGEWISGGKLAESLFVSRNAIWQAVQSLLELGYEIESVTGRGYRLTQTDQPLCEAGIRLGLDRPEAFKILVQDCLPSTNDTLKKWAKEGAEEGLVLVARSQTAGRGRLGRSFFSPPQTGLYFSLLLRPSQKGSWFKDDPPVPLNQWPIRAALATALAIEAVALQECQIKWVNDLYMGSKKIGGILTEAELDLESQTPAFVIIGIGLNLFTPPEGFPPDLSSIVGSICDGQNKEVGQAFPVDLKNHLVADILNRLFKSIANYPTERLHRAYSQRSFLTGKTVQVKSGGRSFQAQVKGIDQDFSLLIEHEDGQEETILSGEASLHDNTF